MFFKDLVINVSDNLLRTQCVNSISKCVNVSTQTKGLSLKMLDLVFLESAVKHNEIKKSIYNAMNK